jgi:hypothetical protein
MENWYEIVEPHRDIQEKKFTQSIFAADLGDVSLGTARNEYKDPYSFTKNTYFTKGITKLLLQVNNRLKDGLGPGIIEIQTPFGGGKTHALISIYHFVNNFSKISELLPEGLTTVEAKSSVVVGTHLNPVEGRKIGDITINTLWGEIAYQINGIEGYKEFERNDIERVSPGKLKLVNFLSKQQPFVLLFDELLQYIAKAIDAKSIKGNLGGQTFAFLQELTETVASIPQGMMVVTLPSSELEDFTGSKEYGLERLNKIFGRIETFVRPVDGVEIYSIIRKRLFQEVNNQNKKQRIINNYIDFYKKNPRDLPQKVKIPEFRHMMDLAYPFHPDTIDLLYEKWGTFRTFQRTRGVLRLLAVVIGDLYHNQKNVDLILPSDINLENSEIRQEFLNHLDRGFESIIASDIAGPQAKAQLIDIDNPPTNRFAQKISTSIFLHSFTVDNAERGIDLAYIKMTTMRPNMLPSNITEILKSQLTGTQKGLWYLHEKENTFYFSNIPSLEKIIRDKKEEMGDISSEIKQLIQNDVGNSLESYMWPISSNNIPDNISLKLAIMDGSFKEREVEDWVNKKGDKFRIHKNTLIFAIPDLTSYYALIDQRKEFKSLKEIIKEIKNGELKSLENQTDDINERIKRIEDNYSYNIRYTYRNIYSGKEKIDSTIPSTGNENLSTWINRELITNQKIVTSLHYNTIKIKLMEKVDRLETNTILQQFYKSTSLPMITSNESVKGAIRRAINEGEFALVMITDSDIQENSIKYSEDVPIDYITFDQNEYVIKKEAIEKIICPICKSLLQNNTCRNLCSECETHLVNGVCPNCIPSGPGGGGSPIQTCSVCGSMKVKGVCPNICNVCASHTENGKCPNICQKCDAHLVNDECPQCNNDQYYTVQLRIEDLDPLTIADINRGIFQPLTREVGPFKFVIEINFESSDGINKETIDSKIREAVEQLGAKISEEKME